jgi:hypothetical protein
LGANGRPNGSGANAPASPESAPETVPRGTTGTGRLDIQA